jgi:hypothetical protein
VKTLNQMDGPMDIPFTGGCACGEIRYRCAEAPVRMYHCHCTDCQKATGTAFHTGVLVPRAAMTLEKGTPKTWDRSTDSGNVITEAFCGTCGSPIYVCSTGGPARMSLKAGSLDDPTPVRTSTQIWTRSAVPWHDTSLATDRHEVGFSDKPKA